jgi:L-fuconolactonase
LLIEEILIPDLLICDPHIHLWDHVDDGYSTTELKADARSGHRVTRSVFIECGSSYRTEGPVAFRPIGETEFVITNDSDCLITGIVGFADLRTRELSDVLAAHIDAGKGRFRGIRQACAWDASGEVPNSRPVVPHLMLDRDFRSGFQLLGKMGLSFDAWVNYTQIPELINLARSFPDTPIILNHLGGPLGVGPYKEKHGEVMEVWRSNIRDIALCPNVTIKLGGIGMRRFGMDWHERAIQATSVEISAIWAEGIRWCIEHFGVNRSMFESNFPVDKASFSYVALWNAFKRMTNDASRSEMEALFYETASTVYRL